jgi:Tol biopolymer transport system component
MKLRYAAILLLIVIAALLEGCGGGGNNNSTQATTPTTPAILFQVYPNLAVADPTTLAETTVSTGGYMNPAWFWGYTQLIAQSPANNYTFSVLSRNGTKVRDLTVTSLIGAQQPVPSPDGTKIAFVGLTSGTQGMYTMPPDGSSAPVLVPGTSSPCQGSCAGFGRPAWSSDGKTLFYNPVISGVYQISSIDMTNPAATPVQLTSASLSAQAGTPAYLNGNLIYSSFSLAANSWVCMKMNLANSSVTTFAADCQMPAASQDGTKVAILSPEGMIRVVDANGNAVSSGVLQGAWPSF